MRLGSPGAEAHPAAHLWLCKLLFLAFPEAELTVKRKAPRCFAVLSGYSEPFEYVGVIAVLLKSLKPWVLRLVEPIGAFSLSRSSSDGTFSFKEDSIVLE